MNKYKRRNRSLRVFTWDGIKPTPVQTLVESTVVEWYSAKHREASQEEVAFVNSLNIDKCPYCDGTHFKKDGHRKDGMQKYFCNDCKHSFNPLSNTIFDSRKIPISEWIEYLLHLFEFHSIKTSAADNRNSNTTGQYWLIKVFEVLKGIQDDVVLDGRIWLDETYFSKKKSDEILKDGKKLRGISRNKIGVGVATDGKHSIFIVTNTSKPSETSTLRTYASHIKEGSTVIHDEEKSHNILVKTLHLQEEKYSSKELKELSDKDNPLQPVNQLHGLMKRFMRMHGSYEREHIQDWMNLFYFIMNEPKDKYDKVLKFIQLAVYSTKRVKYRDAMCKKDYEYHDS